MQQVVVRCKTCSTEMEDKGRSVDYLDDYSPYLDDEGLKLVDGDTDSSEEHECVHLFYCRTCQDHMDYPISELDR